MALDVTYASIDLELVARDTFGVGMPAAAIRLKLSSHIPLVLMMGSSVLYYFVLVKKVYPALRPATAAGKAKWNAARDAWNLSLFLFSAVCCGSAAVTLYQDGQLFVAGSWEAIHCRPVEGTWMRALSTAFTLSKIAEMGDTAFIITLGSKPPEFLHLYHHATTFMLFLFVMCMPGPEKFGLLLNGGVHTAMYSHYWRSWPKPLVPLITIGQICQLAFVTYSWTVSPSVCPTARFAGAPRALPLEFGTPYLLVPVYLYFFLVFFAKRFLGLGGKKSARSKAA